MRVLELVCLTATSLATICGCNSAGSVNFGCFLATDMGLILPPELLESSNYGRLSIDPKELNLGNNTGLLLEIYFDADFRQEMGLRGMFALATSEMTVERLKSFIRPDVYVLGWPNVIEEDFVEGSSHVGFQQIEPVLNNLAKFANEFTTVTIEFTVTGERKNLSDDEIWESEFSVGLKPLNFDGRIAISIDSNQFSNVVSWENLDLEVSIFSTNEKWITSCPIQVFPAE